MNKIVTKLVKIKCQFVRKLHASLRSGKVSNLSSACLKELVHVKIFLFQDMLNESERDWDVTNGLYVLRGLTLLLA